MCLGYCSNNTTTNLPVWTVIMSGSGSPIHKMHNIEIHSPYNNESVRISPAGTESLSARQFGARLWEIHGLRSQGGVDYSNEKTNGSPVGSHRVRSSSSNSQKHQITEYMTDDLKNVGKTSSIEGSKRSSSENKHKVKNRWLDVSNSLVTSKELVKVLFRIMSQEEQQSSSLTLVSVLKVELDRARTQVGQLIQEQGYNSKQMDAIYKQFSEEKAVWKNKEKQKIKEAISSLVKEVEFERELRRQAETLNKKFGREMTDTSMNLTKAMKELDRERRAREISEKLCDELQRGIKEDRAEAEKLKKESEEERKEVEKEREMLQLVNVLREERVQLNLCESRYEYEEKNEKLDRLREELEIYLENGASKQNGDIFPYFDVSKDFDGLAREREGEQSDGEDGSSDSELHSIEVDMDNNDRKCYKWIFGCEGTNQGDSRRDSMEEVFKGRRSLSEKVQWGEVCLQRKRPNGSERDFNGANKQGNVNGFIEEKSSEVHQNGESNECVSPAMSTGKSSRLREACSAILQDLALRREQFDGPFVGSNKW